MASNEDYEKYRKLPPHEEDRLAIQSAWFKYRRFCGRGIPSVSDFIAGWNCAMSETIKNTPRPEPRYSMLVQTDYDFSIKFKGREYYSYQFYIRFDNPKELDEIEILGPHGKPFNKHVKCTEIIEAIKKIKQNPNESFDTTGGNRGVAYWAPDSFF